jgi:hypothetical protein
MTTETARVPFLHTRYYQVPPENKSIEQCASHGRDHAGYGWCAQIDPRWSYEQVAAYQKGYEEGKNAKSKS